MSSNNLPNANDFNIIKNPYYPSDNTQFPYFMLVPEITITTTYKMVPYPLPYHNPSNHNQPTPPIFPPHLNEFYDQIINETDNDQKNNKKK